MGINIANLLVKIGADTSGVETGLDKTSTMVQKTGTDMKKSGSLFADGFQSLTGISLGAAGAISIATMAFKEAVDYSKVAIEAASNMAETQSKVNIVFGTSADTVTEFGETSAEALGMSEESALAAAATYGNLFRAMEIGEKTSAEMSTTLVTLAGDLASFNNMDPEVVLDKLRAGLSGEVEPLRSLGVNLNQALIEEKALELGLWDGVDALDAAQKAQASYSLILEQTALAQGDFDRTSDGLANQQRILQGNTEDLAAAVGEKLEPAYRKLIGVKNDYIVALKEMVEYSNMSSEEKHIYNLNLLRDAYSDGAETIEDYYTAIYDGTKEAGTMTEQGLGPAAKSAMKFLEAGGKVTDMSWLQKAALEQLASTNHWLSIEQYNMAKAAQSSGGSIRDVTEALSDLGIASSDQGKWTQNGITVSKDYVLALLNEHGAVDKVTTSLEGNLSAYRLTSMGITSMTGEVEDQAMALKKNAEEQAILKDKLGELKTIMAGEFGKEIDDFNDKLKTNKQRTQDVKDKISELNDKSYLTSEQKTELSDLKQDLIDLQVEAINLKNEHEIAMKTMAMNMIITKASSDGLTENEITNLGDIMVAWGLWDTETARVVDNINGLNLDDANLEIDKLQENILGIPDKTVTIKIRTEGGFEGAGWNVAKMEAAEGVDLNRNGIVGQALGGPVWANQPYFVGERGIEMFVPQQNGRIEPNGGAGRGVRLNNYGNIYLGSADNAFSVELLAALS